MAANRGSAGLAWGTEVAQAVLAWRAIDGFNASYPPFTGGVAVGQWRPTRLPRIRGHERAGAGVHVYIFVLVSNAPVPARAAARL